MDTQNISEIWLKGFAECLASGDPGLVTNSFLDESWLRDVLTFSWDSRSLKGHEEIANYLKGTLQETQITKVLMDSQRAGMQAHWSPQIPGGVEFGFTFETTIGIHRGYARLLPIGDTFKALTVFVTMDDLKGHEESQSFVDISRAEVESDPEVVIIGAGHCGLQCAARFKQMGIPTLVVETNKRVGDTWRKRYSSLKLHTPKEFGPLLYQAFPSNWPDFASKDKVADWLEQYAITQDLVVWTSSTVVPQPSYDAGTRRWTVEVSREDGGMVTIRPRHLVLSVGFHGSPRIPEILGQHSFQGKIMHTADYPSTIPSNYHNKRVVIIGTGNSAADISSDILSSQASIPTSITMVQRSSVCVVSLSTFTGQMSSAWPSTSLVSTELADFRVAAMPTAFIRNISKQMAPLFKEMDKDMHDGLRKAGMKLNYGRDGSGVGLLVRERAAGYWIDDGCAELISSGKIKIKSLASDDEPIQIQEITKSGLLFGDQTSLDADVIILATGFHSGRDAIKELFSPTLINATAQVWGLDHEDEQRGVFRPTGHPALWYGIGDFYSSRVGSKTLALHIKADMLGLKRNI